MAPASPWAQVLQVGLKILSHFLGGGAPAGDGIDKVDNSSPMQVSERQRQQRAREREREKETQSKRYTANTTNAWTRVEEHVSAVRSKKKSQTSCCGRWPMDQLCVNRRGA